MQKANIPLRLSQWDVQENDLDFLVENAFTKGRIDNNPKPLEKEDVKKIFTTIY